MSIKGQHVLVVGGTSVDTIIHIPAPVCEGPQTIWAKDCYQAVGGTGSGKALNLAQLGFNVSLHTFLGQDSEGAFIEKALSHPRIQLLAESVEQPTERHVNLMEPGGDRVSVFTHHPACPEVIDWRHVEQQMQSTDIAAISILDYTRPALAMAKKYHKPIWIDLHDYDGTDVYHQDFIQAADVLMVSDEKLSDHKTFMWQQYQQGKELVICTHGSRGATALDKQGNWHQQPIIQGYSLADSNGAGDAFFSGFLYGYLQKRDIQACMGAGAMAAAMCISSNQLYHRDLCGQEVDQRLEHYFQGQ